MSIPWVICPRPVRDGSERVSSAKGSPWLQGRLAEILESAGMLRKFARIFLQMITFFLKFLLFRALKSKALEEKLVLSHFV